MAAVVDIIGADVSALRAIVEVATLASPDQKAAIARGLLRVMNEERPFDPHSATIVRAALQCADPVFRALLAALHKQLYAQNGQRSHSIWPQVLSGGGGFSAGGSSGGRGPPIIIDPPPVSPN